MESALRASIQIVLSNVLYFVCVSGLCTVLGYACIASAITPLSLLTDIFQVYALVNEKDLSRTGLSSNPTGNEISPNHSRSIIATSIFITTLAIFMTADASSYNIPPSAGFLFLLPAILIMIGIIYTRKRLSTLALSFPHLVEEERKGSEWVLALERWSISLIQACRWVASIAFVQAVFLDTTIGLFSTLDSSQGDLTRVWRWSGACASVGLIPLIFLSILSTQATLYLSCKTYLNQTK